MTDITSVQIKLSPGPNPEYPWLVIIHYSVFNNMKRFRTLPDALAWTIKEVAKE